MPIGVWLHRDALHACVVAMTGSERHAIVAYGRVIKMGCKL